MRKLLSLFTPKTSAFETELYRQVDQYKLAHAPELIRGIFEKCQLMSYFDAFYKRVEGHFPHTVQNGVVVCKTMALDCYEGALHSHCTEAEIKAALVAGLYANIAREHQRYNSPVSVYEAQAGLKVDHAATPLHQQLKPEALSRALKAIGALQSPLGPKPENIVMGVVVDASKMSPYLPSAIRFALHAERCNQLCGPSPSNSSLDLYYEEQLRVAGLVKWHTRWARLKAHNRNWPLANRQLISELKAAQESTVAL